MLGLIRGGLRLGRTLDALVCVLSRHIYDMFHVWLFLSCLITLMLVTMVGLDLVVSLSELCSVWDWSSVIGVGRHPLLFLPFYYFEILFLIPLVVDLWWTCCIPIELMIILLGRRPCARTVWSKVSTLCFDSVVL